MRRFTTCVMLALLWCGGIHAQTAKADTVLSETNPLAQPTDDRYRVVTNRFWDNWFVLGSVGGHAFFGDYGTVGDFKGKLSPDFNVGVGKWFTPGIGVKLQFGIGNSRGFSKEETMIFGVILAGGIGSRQPVYPKGPAYSPDQQDPRLPARPAR